MVLVGVRGAEPAQNGAASGWEASPTVAGLLVKASGICNPVFPLLLILMMSRTARRRAAVRNPNVGSVAVLAKVRETAKLLRTALGKQICKAGPAGKTRQTEIGHASLHDSIPGPQQTWRH